MPFELSTTITGLQQQGRSVAHSGRVNARRVAEVLEKRFGGPQAPDFLGLQHALAGHVEEETDKLLLLDETHVREVVGSRLQVKERDAAQSEVSGYLGDTRSAVEGVYGEETRIELFGNVSALPQNPLELHRLGTRVHDQLLSEELALPRVKLAGFAPLERNKLAAGLKRPLDRFGKTLSTLSLERKDADATLHDKTAGVEGYRRTVRFAAGCFASLYGLAGFDDLAAKIRPKRRASRRPNGGGPDGPGASDSADGEESPGDASPGDASPGDAPPAESTGPIGIVS